MFTYSYQKAVKKTLKVTPQCTAKEVNRNIVGWMARFQLDTFLAGPIVWDHRPAWLAQREPRWQSSRALGQGCALFIIAFVRMSTDYLLLHHLNTQKCVHVVYLYKILHYEVINIGKFAIMCKLLNFLSLENNSIHSSLFIAE